MKAVILCGGEGTRLREETEFKPKPLVLVGNKPILWHIMKTYSHYGVSEFILCLGYKGDMIKDYFLHYAEMTHNFTLHVKDNEKEFFMENTSEDNIEDWKITFVDTGKYSQTGARIARIKEFLGSDDHFFLTYGDGLSDVNVLEGYKQHVNQNAVVTLLAVKPNSSFGIIEESSDGNLATSFKEKPFLQGLINGGWMVCSKEFFSYLSEDESCVLEDKPLKKAISDGRLAIYKDYTFWKSMDTYKQYKEFNKMVDEGDCPWMVWKR